MDKTLTKICGLLTHPDNRRKCGAALVLAELAPKQSDVVKALCDAIEGSNEQQLACILEALDAIGSPDAVPYVMPLLSSQDIATKMMAISIMAHGGASVIPLITEQMASAPRQYKVVFIDLLARIHSRDSMQILLNMICEKDFQLVKETCEAIRRHVGDATAAKLNRLHTQVTAFLATKKASTERVTASCLLIIGNIGLPSAATLLMKYTSAKHSPYLRKNALIGLKSVKFAKASAPTLWKKLLPLLQDEDTDIIRHSLDSLSKIPDTPSSKTNWKKLLKSKAPAVRAAAARQLSVGDTVETARFLVDLLSSAETDVREIAAGALARHKKAPPLLVAKLATAKDPEYAWRLAKILKPHAETTDKKTVTKLTALAAKDMLAGNARHEAILYFLRHAAPGVNEEVLLEAGTALRKARKWRQAVECLRQLIHTPLFTPDVAYALSVANLKLSHKELSPIVREKDYALRGFQSLLRRGSDDLLARLAKDRSIDAADVYYLGFHFTEGSGPDRLFGEQVMKHLIKKWPKSKEAKAARKKLGIVRPAKTTTKAPVKPKKKAAAKKKTGKRKK